MLAKLFGLLLLFVAVSNAFSIKYYLGTECEGDPVFWKKYYADEHQCFHVPSIGSLSFECDEDTITLEENYIHAVVTVCNQEGQWRDCSTGCNTKVYADDECVTDGQISWTYTCGASSFSALAVFLPVMLIKLFWF